MNLSHTGTVFLKSRLSFSIFDENFPLLYNPYWRLGLAWLGLAWLGAQFQSYTSIGWNTYNIFVVLISPYTLYCSGSGNMTVSLRPVPSTSSWVPLRHSGGCSPRTSRSQAMNSLCLWCGLHRGEPQIVIDCHFVTGINCLCGVSLSLCNRVSVLLNCLC